MAVYDIPTVAGQKKGMVGKCKSFSSWGWFCKRKCLWSHLLSQSNRKYSQFCAKKNLNSALFGIRNQDFNELVRWEGDLKSPPPPLRRLRNNNEKQFSNVKQARTKKHQWNSTFTITEITEMYLIYLFYYIYLLPFFHPGIQDGGGVLDDSYLLTYQIQNCLSLILWLPWVPLHQTLGGAKRPTAKGPEQ